MILKIFVYRIPSAHKSVKNTANDKHPMIMVSKEPMDHLGLLDEMRYVYAMKCSSGDSHQVDQCGRAYGFGAHTLGLYMLLFCPWLTPYTVPNINMMDNRKTANLQPAHHFATIPNWDNFDFDALNEDEDVLDNLGEASLNLHMTRGESEDEDDKWEEYVNMLNPSRRNDDDLGYDDDDDDDAMSDIQPGTSQQEDTNVDMESTSSSTDENMDDGEEIPTDPPDLLRYRNKSKWGMSIHCWWIAPCIATMWVFRILSGQAMSKSKFKGIRRGFEAPRLKVDEIYHATSDEENTIRERRNGRKARKQKPPARTFLQWFVEHLGYSDNNVRSPQDIMESFIYECMGDNQDRLTDTGFSDDYFVHLMENKYVRRYFTVIIPRIRQSITLTYCNVCMAPGMVRVTTDQESLSYLDQWRPDKPGHQTIQSLVEDHFNTETINEEDCPDAQCAKNGGKKTRRQSYEIVTPPDGFVVKLVRGLWSQEKEDVVENTDPIDLGDQEALIRVDDEDEPVKYQLVATVRHTGNNKQGQNSTGHFITYLKHGNSWHCWNDGHMIETDVDLVEVQRSELFLFVNNDCWPEND